MGLCYRGGAAFSKLLKSGGERGVGLPSRSPNLNAYAERFVGSIRRECLSRVIPLGERHLRVLVAEYVEHYNRERNHQGIVAGGQEVIQFHRRAGQ